MNAAQPDHLNSEGWQPPPPLPAAAAAGALRDSAYAQPPSPSLSSAPSLLRRLVFAPVKFFWGMAFCQTVTGALAVTGWTYRLMQRSVLKQWWRMSERPAIPERFVDFAARDPRTEAHGHWPNWFLAQNFRQTTALPAPFADGEPSATGSRPGPAAERVGRRSSLGRLPGRIAKLLKALFTSLWENVRLGVQAIFNTWILTLPACVLMLFGWYDGWNNSFNKGYEQFWVGPAVSWLGVQLFIAAMLYLPLAQARQAITGDWRSFYQFRLVWTLVRRRWLACFGLASLYALCSVPLLILGSVVMFLPNINPKLADLTPAQSIQVLNSFYFRSALFVFPAFVALRLVAARIYGSALVKAVQSGAVAQDALAENEWQALHRLDLLRVEPPRLRHPVWRIAAWAGTRAGRITFGFLTALTWFVFVAQLYIAQFFNYRGPIVWLNQTLVQLPWFHHLPATLKNPWSDVLAAAVIVFVAWRLKRLVVWLKSMRSR